MIKKKKQLILHLKAKYFNQILSGEKKEEYRIYNEYWKKRLLNCEYEKIVICSGYPKNDDLNKRLEFPWNGFTLKRIIHKEFGEFPAIVFALKLKKEQT